MSAGLLLSGGTLLLNLLSFRRPCGTVSEPPPFVSILVPARNEAHAIECCVRSLLAQQYPTFEVLVLDDHSTDETWRVLERLARDSDLGGRLCLLRGESLPPGWSGKNWACHQLAAYISRHSRYLLFTDADTEHAPHALALAMGEVERTGVALLSLLPEQRVESWAEQLVVPLLPLQILGYLPLLAMEWLPLPLFAAANGQFMLFERDMYHHIGGHAACAATLSEDVLLARLVKGGRGKIRLVNGAGLVWCRMYQGLEEVIAGFRRSFGWGFRMGWGTTLAIVLGNVLVYLLPFLRAPFSARARGLALLVTALRVLLAHRTRSPQRGALAHPLGILLLLFSQSLAAYDTVLRRGTLWKGRQYEE